MQILKDKKTLLIKLLVAVFLVFMCCALSKEAFLWKVCNEPDRGPLEELIFWGQCEEQKEALFQETCEEFDRNLPPNTELLVSACTSPYVVGVPDGKTLFVHEKKTGKVYLLDLRTGEKRKVPDDPLFLDHGVFLSSELVWLEGPPLAPDHPSYHPHYILDLTNGKRYELTNLTGRIGQPPPPDFAPYFQSAEQIFISRQKNTAIALPPDFRQNPKSGVVLYKNDLDLENGEMLEMIMNDLRVDYKIVNYSYYYNTASSPTMKYEARNNKIYLSGTDALILDISNLSFIGWYYDESGIIAQEWPTYLQPVLLPESSPGFPVFHPILKLRMPEQDYVVKAQKTAIVEQTRTYLTMAAMPTTTPTLTPTTTYTPTATIVYPTWTPPPTQIFFPVTTPDPTQLEKWQEYETALAHSLLPEVLQESVLCEWAVLGRDSMDVYVMALCGNTSVYATAPTVIHLDENNSIESIEIVKPDSMRDANIRRLFPLDVQNIVYSEAMKLIREELAEHLKQRLSHPKELPWIVLWATPMATAQPIQAP